MLPYAVCAGLKPRVTRFAQPMALYLLNFSVILNGAAGKRRSEESYRSDRYDLIMSFMYAILLDID
jgi:hypothetical protein